MAYIEFRKRRCEFNEDHLKELLQILLRCIRKRQELEADQIQEMVDNVSDFVEAFNFANHLPKSEHDIDVRIAYNDDGDRMELLAMSIEAQMEPLTVPYCVCTIVLNDDAQLIE